MIVGEALSQKVFPRAPLSVTVWTVYNVTKLVTRTKYYEVPGPRAPLSGWRLAGVFW